MKPRMIGLPGRATNAKPPKWAKNYGRMDVRERCPVQRKVGRQGGNRE